MHGTGFVFDYVAAISGARIRTIDKYTVAEGTDKERRRWRRPRSAAGARGEAAGRTEIHREKRSAEEETFRARFLPRPTGRGRNGFRGIAINGTADAARNIRFNCAEIAKRDKDRQRAPVALNCPLLYILREPLLSGVAKTGARSRRRRRRRTALRRGRKRRAVARSVLDINFRSASRRWVPADPSPRVDTAMERAAVTVLNIQRAWDNYGARHSAWLISMSTGRSYFDWHRFLAYAADRWGLRELGL